MNIERILVTGRLHKQIQEIVEKKQLDTCFRFLAKEQVTQEDLEWADAYVDFGPIENMNYKGLKWVHSLGAGVDAFVLNRTWEEQVLLTRTICSFGQRMSEYCLSYMLRDVQKHDTYASQQAEKKWNPIAPTMLSSQTVVIYGTGEIGSQIGRVLTALGTTVYGVSASGTQKEGFTHVFSRSDEQDVLQKADWIISTLPLTLETKRMFDESFFSQLHASSFINVGRGGTVHTEELVNALNKGQVRQAVLDVFAEEPLPISSPLWNHPNITVTPHISAITTPKEAVACFMDTLERIQQGKPLLNKVAIDKGY
ncbi:D-2-hydroxyacid dehydrogenase [Metabacillus iocasae]|uniref:Phosphoglycerate dehydrogenase-like enzyme n=1 Tax=Priestia iocasae TaxID=2291674 RepID=A0ABS2QYM7_9BACI|nr:D-2-hydroxyacid dehydrogenase [Metabacillus iocasae]MBM7704298.1 phosphoglycerate dehydrogenase-like enzyme [Metabacillus iocasae]